ncbi:hypothetical protein AVEN_227373-1 [Araneus ventricosus]|uniref:Uncharacterized protein n=1 Tax=Araneus ventricosus TaxID=182803 RepID=A0A4Y2GTM0_ARAVE|nr:hypothetical protein AVEN_227373-1 [Araneus ventricosus]
MHNYGADLLKNDLQMDIYKTLMMTFNGLFTFKTITCGSERLGSSCLGCERLVCMGSMQYIGSMKSSHQDSEAHFGSEAHLGSSAKTCHSMNRANPNAMARLQQSLWLPECRSCKGRCLK